MNDNFNVVGSTNLPGNVPRNLPKTSQGNTADAVARPERQQALSGYHASREVENQARVTRPMDDPEFHRAIDRLNRHLDSEKPLRHDVPRGFYLNIRI